MIVNMDLSFSKNDYELLNNDLVCYKINILNNIHQKYLSHLDINEIINDFKIEKNDKKKITIYPCNIPSEERCKAKIWKNGEGHQCTRRKKDGIDYCKIHLYKKNYGIFN